MPLLVSLAGKESARDASPMRCPTFLQFALAKIAAHRFGLSTVLPLRAHFRRAKIASGPVRDWFCVTLQLSEELAARAFRGSKLLASQS